MTLRYSPQPGTMVFLAVEWLKAVPDQAAWIAAAVLAEGIGQPSASGLSRALGPAVQHGLVQERIESARKRAYRMGNGVALSIESDHIQGLRLELPTRQTVVPADAATSVFAYAKTQSAAPFRTAKSSDGCVIVQRYGRTLVEMTPQEYEIHLQFLSADIEKRRKGRKGNNGRSQ